MLAVMAASTRMHSSPSRKTSTAMSSAFTVDGLPSEFGSGEPPDAMAVQMSTASTMKAPVQTAMRPPTRAARVPANVGRLAVVTAATGCKRGLGSSFRLKLSAFTFPRQRR